MGTLRHKSIVSKSGQYTSDTPFFLNKGIHPITPLILETIKISKQQMLMRSGTGMPNTTSLRGRKLSNLP